jgi:molybdate transport system substrate-binding protein
MSTELLPVSGIELVGPLPPKLQKVTVFSAGIAVGAKEPEAGKALIQFLASRGAAPVSRRVAWSQ